MFEWFLIKIFLYQSIRIVIEDDAASKHENEEEVDEDKDKEKVNQEKEKEKENDEEKEKDTDKEKVEDASSPSKEQKENTAELMETGEIKPAEANKDSDQDRPSSSGTVFLMDFYFRWFSIWNNKS